MSHDKDKYLSTISEKADRTLLNLIRTWQNMGYTEQSITSKCDMFCQSTIQLFNEMTSEVEESKMALVTNIEQLMSEKEKLIQDLQLEEPVVLSDHNRMSLFQLQDALKKDVTNYKTIVDARKQVVNRLVEQEKELCKLLGVRCNPLRDSPLPSDEEINEYKKVIELLVSKKLERTERLENQRFRIVEMIQELGIEPSLEFEKLVVYENNSSFHLTIENMDKLNTYYESLKKQLAENRSLIPDLRENLELLWDRIEMNEKDRNMFLKNHSGCSVKDIQALRDEISRCEAIKRANIKIFVEKMRQELINWWNKCHFSQDQRAEFTPFRNNCYTEDLLTLHELQIVKLKSYYDSHRDIFDLIADREKLWTNMLELESRADNQMNRYQNRGGQLLKEEKERKVVTKKLARVESTLLALLEKYVIENGKEFLVDGENLKDVINTAWENHKHEKQIKLSAKKQAREQEPTPGRTRITGSACRSKLATQFSSITGKRNLEPALTLSAKRNCKQNTPLSSCKSRLNTPIANITGKRKPDMGASSSAKRSRKENMPISVSDVPVIKVNGSTIKRKLTVPPRRKLNSSKTRKLRSDTSSSTVGSQPSTDVPSYNMFEEYIQQNSIARSTNYNLIKSAEVPTDTEKTDK